MENSQNKSLTINEIMEKYKTPEKKNFTKKAIKLSPVDKDTLTNALNKDSRYVTAVQNLEDNLEKLIKSNSSLAMATTESTISSTSSSQSTPTTQKLLSSTPSNKFKFNPKSKLVKNDNKFCTNQNSQIVSTNSEIENDIKIISSETDTFNLLSENVSCIENFAIHKPLPSNICSKKSLDLDAINISSDVDVINSSIDKRTASPVIKTANKFVFRTLKTTSTTVSPNLQINADEEMQDLAAKTTSNHLRSTHGFITASEKIINDKLVHQDENNLPTAKSFSSYKKPVATVAKPLTTDNHHNIYNMNSAMNNEFFDVNEINEFITNITNSVQHMVSLYCCLFTTYKSIFRI